MTILFDHEQRVARPLVTVIVPVRNGAQTLRNALATVSAQTYENLEIILSDNASSDGTAAIMLDFVARDPRARYVHHEVALPVLQHFSTMIRAAKGKYLLLCAADDRRNPIFVEALVSALELHADAVLAFGCTSLFSEVDEPHPLSFTFDNSQLPKWRRVARSAYRQCFHFYGLWRASVIQRIRIRECTYWPDMQVMMAANCLGTFVRDDRALLYYFEKPKSNKDRSWHQSFQSIPRFIRSKMIATSVAGILDADGGPLLAAFAASLLGLREARFLAGAARLSMMSKFRALRPV